MGPNAEFGHIDVEAGILYRCSIGAKVSAIKRAPPVALSPLLLEKVRRWKEEDGGEAYAIRTLDSGPRRWTMPASASRCESSASWGWSATPCATPSSRA